MGPRGGDKGPNTGRRAADLCPLASAFAHFLRDRRGNVAVLMGLTLSALGIAAGVALDYADLNRTRAELQGTADAAALAGARAMSLSLGQPDATRLEVSRAAAQSLIDSKAPGSAASITPSLADLTVTVRLSLDKPLFFGRLWNRQAGRVGALATATYTAPVSACVVALGASEPVGIDLQGAARIQAARCAVWSNASGSAAIRTQGAADITARKICVAGSARNVRSTPPPETGCAEAPDPYAGRLPNNSGKLCDYTDMAVGQTKAVTLYPGVYCGGLSIGGAAVSLMPGLYEFRDGPLSIRGGSLDGSDVSLLFTGSNAVLDVQGSPTISLSAMSTGPLAGIAIAGATPGTLTSTLQGSADMTVAGSIYLPSQQLDLQGSPRLALTGKQDKVVALSLDLQGSPDLTMNADDGLAPANGTASLRLIH